MQVGWQTPCTEKVIHLFCNTQLMLFNFNYSTVVETVNGSLIF